MKLYQQSMTAPNENRVHFSVGMTKLMEELNISTAKYAMDWQEIQVGNVLQVNINVSTWDQR